MEGTRVEVVQRRSAEWMVAQQQWRTLAGPFACRPAAEQAPNLLALKIDGGLAGQGTGTDKDGSWEDDLQGIGLEELITIPQEHAEGNAEGMPPARLPMLAGAAAGMAARQAAAVERAGARSEPDAAPPWCCRWPSCRTGCFRGSRSGRH
jgi:hypothetical protein